MSLIEQRHSECVADVVSVMEQRHSECVTDVVSLIEHVTVSVLVML